MFGTKKTRICKKCSGLNIKELKGRLDSKDYDFGCLQKCLRKNMELKRKVFGLISGEFAVCNTKEKLFVKIASIG